MTESEARALFPGDVLHDCDPVFPWDTHRIVVGFTENDYVLVETKRGEVRSVGLRSTYMKRAKLHRRPNILRVRFE